MPFPVGTVDPPTQQLDMNPSAPPFHTSPRRIMSKPNWTITSKEVEQGCILWLGTLAETFESQRRRGTSSRPVINALTGVPANDGMYEHPFLVLSRPEANFTKIYFLPMTSLGGKTLAFKFTQRKASYHQSTFLSVTPAEPHPLYAAGNTRYRTLTLENGDFLEKSTYVNVREVYEMDWRDAQLYWGSNPNLRKKWKLDTSSIKAVLSLVSSSLKIGVGRQYASAPLHGYWNTRSQLLQPLSRRLSNNIGTVQRSQTAPVSQPYTPPPTPFLHPSPTSPVSRSHPPEIHPAFQAEFSPPRERLLRFSQAIEERRPLLLSCNPQAAENSKVVDEHEHTSDDGTSEFWEMLLCRCC